MALTTFDRHRAQVVGDRQKVLGGLPFVHAMGELIARTCALAGAALALGLPVALVNLAGGTPGSCRKVDDRLATRGA